MSEKVIEYNDKGLKNFIAAFKGKIPTARVGILGGKTLRKSEGPTNAEIGLKHEFGKAGMPVRSFLRVPIIEHLQQYLDQSGAFNQDALEKVIAEKSIKNWMSKIALVAEKVVLEGFQTGGFGKWKPSLMAHKKVKMTLVETQQLRNSITSDVKE